MNDSQKKKKQPGYNGRMQWMLRIAMLLFYEDIQCRDTNHPTVYI